MKTDVFLYGRTVTCDYFDMYIPSWISAGSPEYREYREILSFIMKIRDRIPESQFSVLENTADSFVFITGKKVSMLCRFCHVCGTDEFGRPICSTEGFAVKNENLNDFWKLIPDAVSLMARAEKTYYDLYISCHAGENKPASESVTEEISAGCASYPEYGQFAELKNAAGKCSRPFSFAYGKCERKLYDYADADDSISVKAFFAADECTEIPDEPEEKTAAECDFGNLAVFAEITRTQQNTIKYKVVLCRNDAAKSRDSIAYESYERENGSEIKISELFRMHESVKEYISRNGADEKIRRKAVPYSSDTEAEFTGKRLVLQYLPPVSQKRSLMQIIKGEKIPDFTESIILRTDEGERKLSEISKIISVSDDSASRLVSYTELMEAAF